MTTIKSCQYRKIMSRTRGKIPTTTGHKKKREREKEKWSVRKFHGQAMPSIPEIQSPSC